MTNNSKKQGPQTAQFGQWLTKFVGEKFPAHSVYYDHGDSVEDNVVTINAIVGRDLTRKATCAQVDVLITNGPDAALIIEIEESPVIPKKILGNVAALLISDHLAIKTSSGTKLFNFTSHTEFIIAGWVPAKGERLSKINDVLVERVKSLPGHGCRLRPSSIDLLFSDSISETIEALEQRTSQYLQTHKDA